MTWAAVFGPATVGSPDSGPPDGPVHGMQAVEFGLAVVHPVVVVAAAALAGCISVHALAVVF